MCVTTCARVCVNSCIMHLCDDACVLMCACAQESDDPKQDLVSLLLQLTDTKQKKDEALSSSSSSSSSLGAVDYSAQLPQLLKVAAAIDVAEEVFSGKGVPAAAQGSPPMQALMVR